MSPSAPHDHRVVLPISEAATLPLGQLGGKAAGLAALQRYGAPIPPTLVVPAGVLEAVVGRLPPDLVEPTAEALAAQIPPDFPESLRAAVAALGIDDANLIVRSSSYDESTATKHAPGVYRSLRAEGASPNALVRAVSAVWASAFAAEAQAYRGSLARRPAMAVVIQPVVRATDAGVLSTFNPDTGDPAHLVVSWAPRGDDVLGGIGTRPTTVVLDRASARDTGDLPPAIRGALLAALDVERAADDAVEVEFAVGEEGNPVLLQLRVISRHRAWRASSELWVEVAGARDLHSGKIAALGTEIPGFEPTRGMLVLRPSAYGRFAEAGHAIDVRLREELKAVLARLVEYGPVALRPAYWSALHDGDALPQAPPQETVDGCLEQLSRLWSFVADHGLGDYTAEPAVLCGRWLLPDRAVVALARPRSGIVELAAIPGYPDGLETLPHDHFIIDIAAGRVIERQIVNKITAVRAPGAQPTPTLADDGREATLTDELSVAIGRATQALADAQLSAVRVEVLMTADPDGTPRPVVWQIDSVNDADRDPVHRSGLYALVAGLPPVPAEHAGRAVLVSSVDALAGMASTARADNQASDDLLVLDLVRFPTRDRDRAAELARRVAALNLPTAIQTSPLSHIAARLREEGAVFWPVGQVPDDVHDGTRVSVVPAFRSRS